MQALRCHTASKPKLGQDKGFATPIIFSYWLQTAVSHQHGKHSESMQSTVQLQSQGCHPATVHFESMPTVISWLQSQLWLLMIQRNQPSEVGGVQVGHDSGTMVAYGTGPMPGATMVVNADASSSRAGTLGPSGTFVTAGGEAGAQGGSDYQAAVQAASQGADGSVVHAHRLFAYGLSKAWATRMHYVPLASQHMAKQDT